MDKVLEKIIYTDLKLH